MISVTIPLAAARLELAGAIADHKALVTAHTHARAFAEQRAIDNAGGDEKGLGSNEKARERSMTIYLAGDKEYQLSVTALRAGEARVTTAQTALDVLLDQRREQEWIIREQLATALLRRNPEDESNHPEDGAFDSAADLEIDAADWPF